MKTKGRLVPASAFKSIDTLAQFCGLDKNDVIIQTVWALKEGREVSITKAGKTMWKTGFKMEIKNETL
jgi:hypothetical protein